MQDAYDVIVCGGGTAGVVAAIQAGRAAGAMAALSAQTGVDPEELPLADVYALLREHRAIVPGDR